MDPLTAIGLASAVVQFVDFGIKVAKRLEELTDVNSSQVPKSMQAISTQLPLLINSLRRVKTDSQIKKLDFDTKCILRGVVAGCMVQVTKIKEMIDKISAAPGDSVKIKIKKTFISFKYDEQVWDIERNLHTYVSVLILHHVVDASASAPLLVEDNFFDIREKRVSDFVERPTLVKELEDHFYKAARSQVQTPTVVLVTGNKGSGKTQLVLEYCHQAYSLGQFQTAFWLNGSSDENICIGLEAAYATIKRSMKGSRIEKLEFVKGFLGDLWHPWLLVFDHYDPSNYEKITELLPVSGYGGVILISSDLGSHTLEKVVNIPRYLTQSEQRQLNSSLMQAVTHEDQEGIRDLVNQGADVNSMIWNEWPCLHRCALLGLEDSVRFLLERGADPRTVETCSSALYWAATEGHAAIFRMLLDYTDASGSVWTPQNYQAAFIASAKIGNAEIADMILGRAEVRLSVGDYANDTPLTKAASNGHIDMVKFLVGKGVLEDDKAQGEQALWTSASDGDIAIVKFLISEGKVNPNAQDDQGRTALYYAATVQAKQHEGIRVNMAEFLLKGGADPNLLSSNGQGPLHQAAVYDHIEMFQLLLAHGADISSKKGGWSPLQIAIKDNNYKTVKYIVQVDMEDPSKRKTMLNEALHFASALGDRNAILQLLKAGADINSKRPSDGAAPLLIAVVSSKPQAARLLARQGADQDIADDMGRLPLPMASKLGFELVVKDMLRAGGSLDVNSGENEDTLLGLAAREGHEKVVRVLLSSGADLEGVNKFGDTALDIAEEKKREKVIEMLEAAQGNF